MPGQAARLSQPPGLAQDNGVVVLGRERERVVCPEQAPVLLERLVGQCCRVEVSRDAKVVDQVAGGGQGVGMSGAEPALVRGIGLFAQPQCLDVVPGLTAGYRELFRRAQGARVNQAQDGDVTTEGIFQLVPGLLVLPCLAQVAGITVLRLEGKRVVLTQDTAARLQDRRIEAAALS